MNVLVTIVLLAGLAAWALAVYRRLARLREEVRLAWKRLEGDQADAAVRTVYNKHVQMYNAALEAFPGSLVGPAAGFTRARVFEPKGTTAS